MNTKNVIILAAGNSSRMGRPKALLAYSDKMNFLEHLCSRYLDCQIENVVVVVNTEIMAYIQSNSESLFERIRLIVNPYPEKGRNFSLLQGLSKIIPGSVFIQNIDNPYVTCKLLNDMDKSLRDYDFVIPVYKGQGGHPLLISENLIKKINENNLNEIPLNRFLVNFKANRLTTTNQEILINLNTINDYNAYKENHSEI